eukprot:4403021-Heterocapsa_arctica.AAC.1
MRPPDHGPREERVRARGPKAQEESRSRNHRRSGTDGRKASRGKTAHLSHRRDILRLGSKGVQLIGSGYRPAQGAAEWIFEQERTQTCHNFGGSHQPGYWPDAYYHEGYVICPPRVTQKEEWRFANNVGGIVYFQGLAFTYLGKD